MSEPAKALVKKLVLAIKKGGRKYVPVEWLSTNLGLYQDVLLDTLVYFEPMIRLNPEFNTKELLPQMEEFIAPTEEENEDKPKRIIITKKEMNEFPTIGAFVYRKFTSVGGLVDHTTTLTDSELRILQKLVSDEIRRRNPKKKKAKKKK
jgi:hypothetical protein